MLSVELTVFLLFLGYGKFTSSEIFFENMLLSTQIVFHSMCHNLCILAANWLQPKPQNTFQH